MLTRHSLSAPNVVSDPTAWKDTLDGVKDHSLDGHVYNSFIYADQPVISTTPIFTPLCTYKSCWFGDPNHSSLWAHVSNGLKVVVVRRIRLFILIWRVRIWSELLQIGAVHCSDEYRSRPLPRWMAGSAALQHSWIMHIRSSVVPLWQNDTSNYL